MTSKIIQDLEAVDKENAVAYGVGDTINVHQLIREGKKERVQRYEGVVISRRNKGNIKEVVTNTTPLKLYVVYTTFLNVNTVWYRYYFFCIGSYTLYSSSTYRVQYTTT